MRSRSRSTFRRTVGVVLAAFSVLAASSGAGAIQIDPGDDFFVFNEDSNTQLLDVLANDPEFSSIVAYDVTGSLGGTVGEAREGGEITLLTYKPAADAFGDDEFTYTTTTSPGGAETIHNVTVTLTPVPDAPVADADEISLAEDGPAADVTAILLAGDSDVDSEVLTIVEVTAASNGTVDLVDGSVTYTPNADYFGDDSFTYTIADDSVPANESEPATVSVTVTPVDDTPDALPDTADVAEGGVVSIDVLANENAADVDDPSLNAITAVGTATYGTTEIVNDKIEYTHNGSETPREDSFTYTINGGDPETESSATVTVTIIDVDDDPVAVDDGPVSFVENGDPASINVVANDTDVDGHTPVGGGATVAGVDPFAVVSVTAPVSATDPELVIGSVAIDEATGEIVYTNTGDMLGDVEFTYTLAGNPGSTATVSVIVTNGDDDAPDVAAPDLVVVDEDAVDPVSIEILTAVQTDADGSVLSIVEVSNGTLGTTTFADGTVEYTPAPNAYGEDSFTVTITDGDDAVNGVDSLGGADGNPNADDITITVSVNITAVDDDAVAVLDAFTVQEDSDAFFLDLLDNDTDVDGYEPGRVVDVVDPLAVVSVSDLDTAIGTLAIVSGGVNFTPAENYFGTFEFTYTLAGDPGSTATVSVEVVNVDDAPVVELSRDLPLDEDAPGPHSVQILEDGETDVDGSLLSIVEGSLIDLDEISHGEASIVGGQFQYVPNENANGTDIFTVTVTDGDGGDDDVTVTITVVITPVNDAPVADDDSYTVDEDAVSLLDVLVGDTDVDEDTLSIASVTQPDPAIGTLAIVGTSVEFTPVENYFGDFTFTYDVNDGTPGETGTDSATVSVTVRNLEDPLIANPDSADVEEDNVVTVDVVDNDVDVDKTGFELVEVEQPDGGFAAITGDGVRVQPDPNFSGTLVIPYGITALAPVETNSCDDFPSVPGCEIVWGTLTVEVGAVNDRPDANHDTAETDEDTPVTIDVLANDVDSDGDALSIDRVGNTQIGTVEIVDNKLVYTPDPDLNGTESFIYYVTDGSLLSVALVTIEVAPINDDPTIVSEDLETDEDTPVTFTVQVADIDSETLTVTELFGPDSGAVTISGTSITYTPSENFFGSDTFVLQVADGDGGFAETFFNVAIAAVNDYPVADDLALDGVEDTPVLGTVVAADVEDVPADLTYEVTTDPANGSVVMTGAGFEYTPEQDYNGEDSFVVTVTDTDELNPGTAVVSVTINLEAVNDAPTITGPELVTTDEDTPVAFTVVPADVDSEILTVSPVDETAVEGGTFSAAGNEITFTPTDNWFGETSVEVTVTDGEYPVSVIVPINVTSVNDLPVGPADDDLAYSGVEDTRVDGLLGVSDVEDGFLSSHVVTTAPEHGVVTWDAPEFGYTPEENFNGEDSFVVTVTDSDGGELEMTVTIVLEAVNDAPTITGPESPVETNEDTPVTFSVHVSDIDSSPLTVSVVEDSAVRGVATVDNKYEVTFVPDPDWHGDSAVDVIVSDGDLSSEALTVPITVTSVNDHPVLSVPAFELDEDSETTVTINVTDVEDDWAERVLDVEIASDPGKGTLEADGNTFTYTGNTDANGSDTFLLSVTDFDGAEAQVLVPVLINPVNDAPTHAACDDVSVETGSEITIDVALCGSDIDGDVLTVADEAMVSNNGTAVIEDGMIVFAPADGYIGTTAVGFFLTDGTDSVETSIAIEVTEKVNPYIGTAGKDGQLVRIYSAMLGRLPDSKGFTYWSEQLEDGMTIQQLIRYFGTSDEFLNTYGDRLVSDSDADWIEFVYNEILERPSDAKGRAYWTDQLAGGLSRADMVTFFAESSEYKTQTQTL